MKSILSNHSLQHFAVQLGLGAALAVFTYLAGADYSALGAFAPIASAAAGAGLAYLHKTQA